VAEPSSVSAVVITYDGKHLLEIVLPSLAAQTYGNFGIVVVDNGSRDGSSIYLAEHWPGVNVVALSDNVGVAAALNRGIAAASGEYVALLNNDLELEPTWLAEMVAGIERHTAAATVACKLRSYSDHRRLDGAGDVLTRAMVAYRRGHGDVDRGQYDSEEEIFAPTAGAALYRASALADVGGFDESFFAYLEDVDWGLRARLAGYESWYLPTAVAYHMGGATTGGERSAFYFGLLQRNRMGLIVKDLPLSVLARIAGVLAASEARTAVHQFRRGNLRPYLRALASALPLVPGWLRARRGIQRERRMPARALLDLLA
jgi:GT2 family glycosyltransferase